MKHRKLIAMLLCLSLLAALFAGCGSTAAPSDTAETASTAEEISEAQPEADSAAQEAPQAEPAEVPIEGSVPEEEVEPLISEADDLFVDVDLPLVEDRTTLTMWWGGYDGGNFGNDNPGVTLMSQAAIELTNVEIEYGFCAGMEFITQTQLMYAAGDWPDMIKMPSLYTGGLSAGVQENVFLDLADNLAEYSPNYYGRITADPDVYRQATTDEGYVAAYFTLNDKPARQNTGLIVRSDYLETLGMDVPKTYDDWHTMLTGFKDDLGLKEPFILDTTGLLTMLMEGYGVNADWYQIDNVVGYSPIEPGFKDYLTMINQWYNEGLISQDFMNSAVADERLNKVYDGDCGAYVDDFGSITSFKTLSEDPNFASEAAPAPVVNPGDQTHFYSGGQLITAGNMGGVALSTDCTNVELCMRWMDFFYSKEGSLIYSYGKEGETYVDNGDGTYSFTDMITNNPDWGITFAKLIYLDGCAGTGLHWTDSDIINLEEGSLAAEAVWATSDNAYVMPSFDLNGDDANTFSNIMGDVETYVNEMVMKFITGAESLDNFDSYVETVKSMGVEEAIALKQTGLDRYNAR